MKQLRFTTTKPMALFGILSPKEDHEPLVVPEPRFDLIQTETKAPMAFINGEAETLAGFDVPLFIDGDMGQLDLPADQQDIIMLLPSGEYKCRAELFKTGFVGMPAYLITLAH